METVPFKLRVSRKMYTSMMRHAEIDWDAVVNAEIKKMLRELGKKQPLR